MTANERGRLVKVRRPTPAEQASALPELPWVAVAHSWVDTGRIRMHVAEAGPGTGADLGAGATVLLVHGWPQHWYAWRHVVPLLAAEHHVVCVDLRGSGWSDAPPHGYTTTDGVADLAALIGALNLDRPVVVGHDWGGWLALHLALQHPDAVAGVLATGTAGPWLRARPMLRHAWWYATTVPFETPLLGRWTARHLPALVRLVLRRSAGPDRDQAIPRPVLDRYTAVLQQPDRARASERLQHHRGYGEVLPTLTGRYRGLRLSVPALMLVGDRDPGLSAPACRTALPYADDLHIRTLPGCGHLVPEERPHAVAQAAAALSTR